MMARAACWLRCSTRRPPRSFTLMARHRTACRQILRRWHPTRAAPTPARSEPGGAGPRRSRSTACAPPPDLRRYLLERASEGAGASSLTVFVSALRKLQALAEMAQTARDQMVIDTLSGLARQACTAAAGARAHGGALAAIYETACFPRVGRGGVLEGAETALRRGVMDIALCWVMSDAGLRRSEAAALAWDDIARWDNGSGRMMRTGLNRFSVCLNRRSRAASRPRPGRPAWGPTTAAIPGGSGWHGAWRRDAGKAPVWSPTTRGLKTPNAPPNGWGRFSAVS